MIFKVLRIFRRALGFVDQTVHIFPQHCARVVYNEEWIKLKFLEFTLTSEFTSGENFLKTRPCSGKRSSFLCPYFFTAIFERCPNAEIGETSLVRIVLLSSSTTTVTYTVWHLEFFFMMR